MSDLQIHPSFQGAKDDSLFQSSEGMCFYFSLSSLSIMSSFFKDLASVPVAAATEGAAIIPLPAATTAALEFALGSIRATLRGEPLPEVYGTDKYDAIIKLSDAYDLPIVVNNLFRHARVNEHNLLITYTLAIMTKDEKEIHALSKLCLVADLDGLEGWPKTTLMRWAPEGLIRIYDLQRRWGKVIDSFRNNMQDIRITRCIKADHGEHVRLRFHEMIHMLPETIKKAPPTGDIPQYIKNVYRDKPACEGHRDCIADMEERLSWSWMPEFDISL